MIFSALSVLKLFNFEKVKKQNGPSVPNNRQEYTDINADNKYIERDDSITYKEPIRHKMASALI